MGGKSSRTLPAAARAKENGGDGQTTLRAISKGRVYVVITFPAAVQRLENCHFNEGGYDELLGDLQQVSDSNILARNLVWSDVSTRAQRRKIVVQQREGSIFNVPRSIGR